VATRHSDVQARKELAMSKRQEQKKNPQQAQSESPPGRNVILSKVTDVGALVTFGRIIRVVNVIKDLVIIFDHIPFF